MKIKKYLLVVVILLTLLLVSVGLLFAQLSTLRPEPKQPPSIYTLKTTEILNPETTPTKLTMEQALKAVESLWALPETTEIRAHLLKDHYFETITWELQWRKNGEIIMSASVEANSGEVLIIFDWSSHQGTEDRLKDPAKAINIALDLLKKLGIPTQNLSKPQIIKEEQPGKFAYKVLWKQEHQGVPVLSGSVFVSIDSQNEKPVAFGRTLINTEGIKTEPQISKEKVTIIARDFADYLCNTHPKFMNRLKIGRETEIKLVIGKPVNYWEEPLEYRDLTLVWIVSMERIKPLSGFIDIWVDALNGEIVGGDQTR